MVVVLWVIVLGVAVLGVFVLGVAVLEVASLWLALFRVAVSGVAVLAQGGATRQFKHSIGQAQVCCSYRVHIRCHCATQTS